MSADLLARYLNQIKSAEAAGNATEHTYRPALKLLLEDLAAGVTATNEPKRAACGAPDYCVSRTSAHGPLTIGYVEAKDVGTSLDEIERSPQVQRYRAFLANLLLTDYVTFRWYVEGQFRAAATLATVGSAGLVIADAGARREVVELLQGFLGRCEEPIATARDLAVRMARLTHMVRDLIAEAFKQGRPSETLRDLRRAFAATLIPDLELAAKIDEFADMLAQTISYGLFAARCNHPLGAPFQRLGAAREIPKTNPFLRELFETIAGNRLDEEPYAGFVDDLVQLLAGADLRAILADFGRRGAGEDPTLHFYETFLAAYDPALREKRGVYYTPYPVVSYIVRSVDHLLRERFACPDGLADTSPGSAGIAEPNGQPRGTALPRVLILDPACGTGTFLYAVVDHLRQHFAGRGQAGMWPAFVKTQLLPRLFGFELLMAPYAVAHFKLAMQLAGQDLEASRRGDWQYDFALGDRLGIFLTNALELPESLPQGEFKFIERILAREAAQAAEVKQALPIMVVLGNPPYSGHSANRSWRISDGKKKPTFIGQLLRDYYQFDGQPLGERNPKWLQDDYVKFIRFGQWRIEKTGAGILAFITNNGYLDNPTFRGMRQQLLRAFSEIYVLNLHGNSKKREKAPDGSPDENVFDIQQGVAIGIFVKQKSKPAATLIHYADLPGRETVASGRREDKYAWLARADASKKSTPWRTLKPRKPLYLFIPATSRRSQEYDSFVKITDLMKVNVLGFQSHRDHFAVAFDRQEILDRVAALRNTALTDQELRHRFDVTDNRDWQLAVARSLVQADRQWREKVLRCAYRPFDYRFCYFSPVAMDYPRQEIQKHVAGRPNLCLNLMRQTKAPEWRHVLISDVPTPAVYLEIKDGSTIFPLYRYPDPDKNGELFANGSLRKPNLDPRIAENLAASLSLSWVSAESGDLKKSLGPENIVHYLYAVLHSTGYRERYAELLRLDFPRIPFTTDRLLFRTLCRLGAKLVAWHLMKPPGPVKLVTSFPCRGSDLVEKSYPRYYGPGEAAPGEGRPLRHGRIYINHGDSPGHGVGQYFGGVPPEIWSFQFGGYQVCHKWLADRQGRKLSFEDIEHYQKTVLAIHETLRLVTEIDAAIERRGGWPLAGAQ